MCRIFSAQTSERYAHQTRSIRLSGHATSIRLEAAFWEILEEIARLQGVTLGRFLTKLHDEVLEFNEESVNFTALLRCACLTYLTDVRDQEDEGDRLRREAAIAFQQAAE